MNITIITYKDQDIDILINENEVQWSMERNGNKYGNAVILPSAEQHDLVGAIGTIIINAIRTIEELDKAKEVAPKKVKKTTKKKSKKKALK